MGTTNKDTTTFFLKETAELQNAMLEIGSPGLKTKLHNYAN